MKKYLKRLIIFLLIIIPSISFADIGLKLQQAAPVKRVSFNGVGDRTDLYNKFLQGHIKEQTGVTVNDIDSNFTILKKVIDKYRGNGTPEEALTNGFSPIATALYNEGEYDGDGIALGYSTTYRNDADKNFLLDYGTALAAVMPPYDISYKWGGNHVSEDALDKSGTSNGMDCSGFIHFLLRAGYGYDLPSFTADSFKTTMQQFRANNEEDTPQVATLTYSGKAIAQHIVLYGANHTSMIHARGGQKIEKTIDITKNYSGTGSVNFFSIRKMIDSNQRQSTPYSPKYIANLISKMRQGNRDGSTTVGDENSDTQSFLLDDIDVLRFKIDLDTVVLGRMLKAYMAAYQAIKTIILAIIVLLSAVDVMWFLLKKSMQGAQMDLKTLFSPLFTKFTKYALYIALVKAYDVVVMKPVMRVFGGTWLKLILGIDTGGKEYGNLTLIYQSIIADPLQKIIEYSLIIGNQLDLLLNFNQPVIPPNPNGFMGTDVIEPISSTHFVIALFYIFTCIFVVILMLAIIGIVVIFALLVVFNIVAYTLNVLAAVMVGLFPIAFGTNDALRGFGIAPVLSVILKYLILITVPYIYINMVHQATKMVDNYFNADPSGSWLVFIIPTDYVMLGGVYLMVLILYRKTTEVIEKSI